MEIEKLEHPRIKLIQEDETIDNPKQLIHEIVQNIISKEMETSQKRSKEADKELKRLLSGKLNRKRKYEISIKIFKKLKKPKTLTQKEACDKSFGRRR